MRPASRPRLFRRSALVLLAVIALLGLCHPFILRMMAWPLVACDPPVSCDYYCLHGDEMGAGGFEPFVAAAEWRRQRAGREILLLLPHDSRIVEIGATPSFERICRVELGKKGIAADEIRLLRADACDVWDEIRGLSTWLKDHAGATVNLAATPSTAGGCAW